MKRIVLVAAVFVLAATLFFAHAQTIGGDTSLASKTWTFTGLTANLPTTTLFTPAADSDFLMTVYVSTDPTSSNLCVLPSFAYTDDYGSQHGTVGSGNGSGITMSGNQPQGGATHLHVKANTAVSISANFDFCGNGASGAYELIVSKTKLNP